ncbi:MAG: hypothetical protein NC122_09970 [Faecalibacterium sp.]|nr:hypothetical protein [Ruminococcus sp.]MCM1393006.1 hypothetical protein [Ruminococcus sp.]MCM1486516.1 hypothetical protein [Faecalibacterium sp.]
MRIAKKIGIALCFAVAVIIIFSGSANRLLIRKRVAGMELEGRFTVERVMYQSPLSSQFYSDDELNVTCEISDEFFDSPDFDCMGETIEKPVYEYNKESFKVVDGKTYALLVQNDGEFEPDDTNSVDVSAYLTRIALKVFDSHGNDTGYVLYKFIDADKHPHIYLAKFDAEDDEKIGYASLLVELRKS